MENNLNLTNFDPETAFTQKRRRLEYEFLKEERRVIDKLDIPKEDKNFMKDKLLKYHNEYEEQYYEFTRIIREYHMWTALAALNKKMGWPKSN